MLCLAPSPQTSSVLSVPMAAVVDVLPRDLLVPGPLKSQAVVGRIVDMELRPLAAQRNPSATGPDSVGAASSTGGINNGSKSSKGLQGVAERTTRGCIFTPSHASWPRRGRRIFAIVLFCYLLLGFRA